MSSTGSCLSKKLNSVGWGETWMGDHLRNKKGRRHQTGLYSLESQTSVTISASRFNNDCMCRDVSRERLFVLGRTHSSFGRREY